MKMTIDLAMPGNLRITAVFVMAALRGRGCTQA